MEFTSKRLRVKIECEDSGSGPPIAADEVQELTMCQIYSPLCAEHSCDPDNHCYGRYSCAGQHSGCYAETTVPTYVGPEGDSVSLVRARDLPLLRLGLDSQLPSRSADPSS